MTQQLHLVCFKLLFKTNPTRTTHINNSKMSNVEQPFMQGIDDGWNLKNYLNIQSTSL